MIATPDIRDAERLQGFRRIGLYRQLPQAIETPAGKLVGNAVTVNAAEWIGSCLTKVPKPLNSMPLPFDDFRSWPKAAYGAPGKGKFEVEVSMFPIHRKRPSLERFLKFRPIPLSHRAVAGFTSRLCSGGLNYPEEFLDDLLKHKKRCLHRGK